MSIGKGIAIASVWGATAVIAVCGFFTGEQAVAASIVISGVGLLATLVIVALS